MFSSYKDNLTRVSRFLIEHERSLSYAGLVAGFVFDAIFFRRVDVPFENIAIILHFVVGFFAILLMHVRMSWYEEHAELRRLRAFLPFILQFAIGGLFGKFAILYSRSGALIKSWPFILMLAVLFIGNEWFRERYERLHFRLAIFFTALFSYCIFSIPVLTKSIEVGSFVLSGVVSLALMVAIIELLNFLSHESVMRERLRLYGIIAGIFVVFQLFYFTNIIPPIPLALKESGVYHSIERNTQGNYVVVGEAKNWSDYLKWYEPFHLQEGRPVYVYSAIFSPTDLNTNIVHEWQYYDDVPNEWVSVQRVELPIVGGRDGGFRTYSLRSAVRAGSWRVNIETLRGQLIGRLNFEVFEARQLPTLLTDTLE